MYFDQSPQRWDGTIFPVEVNASFLQLADKEYLVAVARDITQKQVAHERISRG
ncbi:MAG: PAS domain S-box protein [Deltaproteobacteria bacterium]|uniref:PAS domain S-box protein n=1 Tax=Desulfobacula sp. TaxID=2593537 RepID=UPI0019910F24|nr:PAS domain S-box protein [Candidatus Desulfobacula maris]MBL6995612.1 PAS domain S-box protein [Desulfobacula sp.]